MLRDMFTRLTGMLLPMKLARTPAERQVLLQQRYAVYRSELDQERPGFDDEAGTLTVPEDAHPTAFHAYVGPADAPSASLLGRHYAQDAVPAGDQEGYALHLLPDLRGQHVSFLSHLVARRSARGTMSVISLISAACEHLATSCGAAVVLIDCKPGLVQSYRKMGLFTYGAPTIPCSEGVLIPMMAIAGDAARLRSIGSPLYPMVRRLERSGHAPPADLVAELRALARQDPGIEVDPVRIAAQLDAALGDAAGAQADTLPTAVLARLAASGFALALPSGTELTRTGAVDREMYIVLEGALDVSRDGQHIRRMGVGEIVGDVAFFRPTGARSATLHAHGDTRVLVVRRKFVERVRAEDPALAADFLLYVATVLAERFARIG